MLQETTSINHVFSLDTPRQERRENKKGSLFDIKCPSTLSNWRSSLKEKRDICYVRDIDIDDINLLHQFMEKGVYQDIGVKGEGYSLKIEEGEDTYYGYMIRHYRRHKRIKKHIESHLKRETQQAHAKLNRYMRHVYETQEELEDKVKALSGQLIYHRIEYTIKEKYKAPLKGTPHKRERTIFAGYQLDASLYEKQTEVMDLIALGGVGILLTRYPRLTLTHTLHIFDQHQLPNKSIRLKDFAFFRKSF